MVCYQLLLRPCIANRGSGSILGGACRAEALWCSRDASVLLPKTSLSDYSTRDCTQSG